MSVKDDKLGLSGGRAALLSSISLCLQKKLLRISALSLGELNWMLFSIRNGISLLFLSFKNCFVTFHHCRDVKLS